jgi:hypothetical protein
MATEPKTGLDFWTSGILQPDLIFNDLLLWVAAWAQPVVLSFENAPPSSPDDGDMHLVGVGTGAFAGHDDALAYWDDATGIWLFFPPGEQFTVRNAADDIDYRYTGSEGWVAESGGAGVVSVNGATGAVVLTDGDIVGTINAQVASYTAVLADEVVTMDNAAPNNFTVPPNSSVAFPVGRVLEVWQKGAGQTTIVAGAGVTILYGASVTLKLKEQDSGCSLRKVATDTWRLIGDMEPL